MAAHRRLRETNLDRDRIVRHRIQNALPRGVFRCRKNITLPEELERSFLLDPALQRGCHGERPDLVPILLQWPGLCESPDFSALTGGMVMPSPVLTIGLILPVAVRLKIISPKPWLPRIPAWPLGASGWPPRHRTDARPRPHFSFLPVPSDPPIWQTITEPPPTVALQIGGLRLFTQSTKFCVVGRPANLIDLRVFLEQFGKDLGVAGKGVPRPTKMVPLSPWISKPCPSAAARPTGPPGQFNAILVDQVSLASVPPPFHGR